MMRCVYGTIPINSTQNEDFTEIIDLINNLDTKVNKLIVKVNNLETSSEECCTKTQQKLNRIIKLLKSGTTVEDWQTGVEYYVGDLVMYDGVEYICVQENTVYDESHTPNVTPALWEVYVQNTNINNETGTEMIEVLSEQLPSVSTLDTYEMTTNILGKEKIKKVRK